jgi:acetylornithine/succinyldiaminopimelate/putrescine aminotransferase
MAVSERTAAIIVEVVQGEGGIRALSPDLIILLRNLQERYHYLIIADEIQSGIGRTGTFFAFEQFGIKPDIVVAAKALGGGLPLGAIITSDEIASVFKQGVHGTTFGGNALSCVAGSVVLDELSDGLMDHVRELSEWFFSKLASLQLAYSDHITEIRGKGLMIGLEFKSDVKRIQQALLDRYIITNVTADNVLRLLPPLTISEAELSAFINTLAEVL